MKRGTRVGQAYVAITADGSGINEEIVDSVDEAGKDIDSKGEEHGDKYGEGFSDGFISRIRGRLVSRLSNSLDGESIGGRAGDDAGESFVDRMSDKVRDMGDKISAELSDRIASRPEQVRRGIDRAFDDDFADRLGDRFSSRFISALESRFGDFDLEGLISKSVSGNGGGGSSGGKKDGLSGLIGRMLGEGSRNNFLNFFGRTMGNVVGLVEKAGTFASTFATNMSKAGESATLLQRLMAGFGGGGAGIGGTFAKLGASLPVLAASAGALLITMSALVSVVGALAGIVTALASTIASALVGALLVLGPLIGSVVVAGGLLAVAFTSMTNAQKDYLTNAFYPFKAALTGVGQIIMTEFTRPLYNGQSAIQVWSTNLQRALVPIAGVAATTAQAFARSINIITASFSGPGFQKFFTSLGTELPRILVNLSQAFGRAFNGIGAVFAAILPYVTQFTKYLADAALRFSTWANSAKGQNSIVQFVDRAVTSLKSLWGFLKQVGGLIADVLFNPTSQKAGNTIFDRMAGAFLGMRRAFDKALKDGSVERWFNDAIKFGGALWSVLKGLWNVFLGLYNSGVITAISEGFNTFGNIMGGLSGILGPLIDALGWALPNTLAAVLTPLQILATAIIGIGEAVEWVLDLVGVGNGAEWDTAMAPWQGLSPGVAPGIMGPIAPGLPGNMFPPGTFTNTALPEFNIDDLFNSGDTALDNTFQSMGGNMPDPTSGTKGPKFTNFEGGPIEEWANPYAAFAASLIKRGNTLADEIRASAREARDAISASVSDVAKVFADLIKDTGSSFLEGVSSAAMSTDVGSIISGFEDLINNSIEGMNAAMASASAGAQAALDQAYATRDQMVNSALAARSAAAQRLASASSPKEARAALEELKRADKDLELAQRKGNELVEQARQAADRILGDASAQQARVSAAQNILAQQAVFSQANANALIAGQGAFNATLADYAEARRVVAEQLSAATQKLIDAISLRDNYNTAVADSVRSFGSLLTAQAKTIDGVQQALTFGDITDNLRSRLDKVKAFQENLRLLLANGLSDAAYKQLVDAGVDQGGAYAQAILDGGSGAVSEVNSLLGQFDLAANELGGAASSQLYQAGVDAAQGLVDGLLSLSEQLDSAATQLGNSIAQAIKNALGIASPSRVLMGMMDDVGDGAVVGLDNQQVKVSAAAARMAGAISVSPEVAAYAASQNQPPAGGSEDEVSGNDRRFRDLIVQTPTEDPMGVAMEVLNEVTGRLP